MSGKHDYTELKQDRNGKTKTKWHTAGAKLFALLAALFVVAFLADSLGQVQLSRSHSRRVGPPIRLWTYLGAAFQRHIDVDAPLYDDAESAGAVDSMPWFVTVASDNLSGLTPFQFLQRETYLQRVAAESSVMQSAADAVSHAASRLWSLANGTEPTRPKLILYWTPYFESPCYGVGCGSRPFTQCSTWRGCVTTTDKSRLPEADAVIFHGRNIVPGKLPARNAKPPGQKWVFLLDESATHSPRFLIDKLSPAIDWTMTYRLDSDIYRPYGIWHPWKEEPSKAKEMLANVVNKTKSVAWITSHCHPESKREKYALELQKYIDMDIYGACSFHNARCPKSKQARCLQMLEDTYFFYLAFENSHCRDYITEKFWRHLTIDIVPVVLGGSLAYGASNVTADDYSSVAPPTPHREGQNHTDRQRAMHPWDQLADVPTASFIHAKHFATPRDLANHLLRLREDLPSYMEHLRWKERAAVAKNGHAVSWCSLCAMLHGVGPRGAPLGRDPRERAEMARRKRRRHWLTEWWFNGGKCGGNILPNNLKGRSGTTL